MPSDFSDELARPSSLEDQRALQVALEMLGFQESAAFNSSPDHITALHYDDMRFLSKKSQNMTECVPVPSSEHVAEIVGRQGCKIKALRAKTNTYIKTPIRGEEPVFVVTGRKEDVAAARREILSAAEHFSQIRASRRNGLGGQGLPGSSGLVPPPPIPGQITIQVRVPYRVVGLVVGPKGATIKRIQQQTGTFIVTPSREKEPIFEVTGLPDSVEQAKREIEAHIAVRTGLLSADADDINAASMGAFSGFGLNLLGSAFGLDSNISSMSTSELMSTLYKTSSSMRSSASNSDLGLLSSGSGFSNLLQDYDLRSAAGSSNLLDYPASSSSASKLATADLLGGGLLSNLYDSDEGIGLGGSDSPTLGPSLIQPNIWSADYGLASKRSGSFAFPSELGGESEHHLPARRTSSDPLSSISSALASFSIGDSDSGTRDSSVSASGSASPAASPVEQGCLSSGSSTRGSLKRECIMCCEGDVVAALVPCGHNLFCMDCAGRLAKVDSESGMTGQCPVCQKHVTQAIRIFS